jgi:hypothetical protein
VRGGVTCGHEVADEDRVLGTGRAPRLLDAVADVPVDGPVLGFEEDVEARVALRVELLHPPFVGTRHRPGVRATHAFEHLGLDLAGGVLLHHA